MLGLGIIGCGLIGRKRAEALGTHWTLVACADPRRERAQSLANGYTHNPVQVFDHWQTLLTLPEVDAVVIATTHDALVPVACSALCAGKPVLIEKPAARSVEELIPLLELALKQTAIVRVGFNHRYHRAMRKTRELLDADALGELMFIRARYGHGGRVGYDREWRSDPAISGGGELLDQGTHLIDLSRWFLGKNLAVTCGKARTFYWNMPVDDNAFMLLETAEQQIAFLHASCTEWKNLFSFEIYGRKGKIEISGLGGSYGVEKITWYNLLPTLGPPETMAWEYPMSDDSWEKEMDAFYDDIVEGKQPQPGLPDALEVLKVVQSVYRGI